MRFIAASFMVFAAVFAVGMMGSDAQAQTTPAFASPSGCRTTTLKNTLLFTQARTGNPGDTSVVVGAYTVTDDDPEVQDTGSVENANCNPASSSDGHPTHVTSITVTLAGGDLVAADVRAVKLHLDGNQDGFIQAGQDQQIGNDLPGTCLFTECVFNFGRSTPLFSVHDTQTESQTATVTENPSEAFIISVDLGPNARAGANLMINVMAESNDIVVRGVDSVSSDFNDTFRSQTSNIILNSLTGGDSFVLRGVNNGSGNPETGMRSVEFDGLLTRFRDQKIVPGTRETIAAMIYVCEGGTPVTPSVVILPAIAKSDPTIAGYPDVLACITSSIPDTIGTRLLRVRVGVSGNSGAVGTMRLYDDANDNGVLFEGGELVLSANPVGGVAIFGSLNNPLLSGTRPNAEPAPGVYAPQTGPNVTLCDSTQDNPKPGGASKGCPHLLVFTFDVNSNAQPGDVNFDIVLDVGNLPGEGTESATASSNLISTASTRSKVTIEAREIITQQKSLLKLTAEHSGNPNVIEDDDIFWAMRKWTNNEPLNDDNLKITDGDMLTAVRYWSDGTSIAAATLGDKRFGTLATSFAVSQKTSAVTVAPGESFLVTTTIEGKSVNGLLMSPNLPDGWTVTSVKKIDAAFNGSGWLWLNLNGKITVTYKVIVPASAKNGLYTIGGQLKVASPAYEAAMKKIIVRVAGDPVALKVNEIHLSNGEFIVEGAGISSTSIELFSLSGAKLFAGSAEGNRVMLSNAGSLANGVYLYLVTIRGTDGTLIRRFNKLIVRH
ncbi:hypothetical protein HYR54_06100 [Candidatus Acetothermia bacterium]|nr:hypothetical protein [Candidatus Acetothermia bacterium]